MTQRSARPLLSAAGAVLLLTGLAACGGSDTASSTLSTTASSSSSASSPAASSPTASSSSATGSGATATGSLTAADQAGDGTTLTVASVDLNGIDGGWVAVHSDLGGKPGPVVGVVQVKKGATNDVKVALDKKVATGAYWPMLHVDDSTIGTYEFPKTPGADLPVKSGSDIVMKKVTLTVT